MGLSKSCAVPSHPLEASAETRPVEDTALALGLLQWTTIARGCCRCQEAAPTLPWKEASAIRAFSHVQVVPIPPLLDQSTTLTPFAPPLNELQRTLSANRRCDLLDVFLVPVPLHTLCKRLPAPGPV